MQKKASWRGLLKIAGITIGIKLFGIQEKEEKYYIVCRKHLLPIRYEKVCEKGEKLSKQDIAKAIKTEQGFEIIEKKDHKKQEHIIEINKFSSNEPIFIKSTYTIKPDKGFDDAIDLIKDLMIKKGVNGYGHFYIHNAYENVCMKAFNELQKELILYLINKKQKIGYDETEIIANAISSLIEGGKSNE